MCWFKKALVDMTLTWVYEWWRADDGREIDTNVRMCHNQGMPTVPYRPLLCCCLHVRSVFVYRCPIIVPNKNIPNNITCKCNIIRCLLVEIGISGFKIRQIMSKLRVIVNYIRIYQSLYIRKVCKRNSINALIIELKLQPRRSFASFSRATVWLH